MLIRMAIRGPSMLIFAMIVSFRISRQISLIFVAVIPVLAALLALIVLKVHPVFKRVSTPTTSSTTSFRRMCAA